jgi:hypothetical protein
MSILLPVLQPQLIEAIKLHTTPKFNQLGWPKKKGSGMVIFIVPSAV